jgi:hypothetical protein
VAQEITATPTKQSTAAKPNRKYFTIFHSGFALLFSSLQPQASSLQNLIDTPRLEFALTRCKQIPKSISNRYKIGIFLGVPKWHPQPDFGSLLLLELRRPDAP